MYFFTSHCFFIHLLRQQSALERKFKTLIYYQFYNLRIGMRLSDQEKLRYSKIIFNSQGKQKNEIDDLTYEQLDIIRSLYAQKIAYEAANTKIQQFNQEGYSFVVRRPYIPNFCTTLCCCCFPEDNRDFFDITTTVFLQRVFYPFLFWKNEFLKINDGKPEKYGVVWILFTYVIVMGLSSNLNLYFITPTNFKFDNEIMTRSLGIVVIFKIAEPLIYTAVIGCLGGFIQNNHSFMITSYSAVLLIVPILFCIVPSMYWHLLMLAGGSILRGIFLFRNYQTKLQSKSYILFFIIAIMQAIYVFILLKVMFLQDAGYGFTQGFNTVFDVKPTITQSTGASEHLSYFTSRHFQN